MHQAAASVDSQGPKRRALQSNQITLSLSLARPSARAVLGQSSGRLPQLQLHAHPAAGLQEPAVLPARHRPGEEPAHRFMSPGGRGASQLLITW